MASHSRRVLTINAGSSSIKFALFESQGLRRLVSGAIERIGLPGSTLTIKSSEPGEANSRPVNATDQDSAVRELMPWIEARADPVPLSAVAHRIVQGGPNYDQHQRLTAPMLEALRALSAF